jgi:RNA polymerase sigma-70 factor, ECF subfamily
MSFDRALTLGFVARMTETDSARVDRTSPDPAPEMLLARIATSDRDAYAALFLRFAPKIKAFVMGQGLTAQEAEDLAQEVMLSVWRKAHMFDASKASAVTWIYSIARNLRIDLARKAKRVRELPHDLWQGDSDKGADGEMILAEDAASVAGLLDTLPKEQKTILRLSFYEDLSHGDIAKALAIPLGTVKSRMRLAMSRLKAGMARSVPEERS